MSTEKKIRLKEMSHKKLRKLCKKLGKELQQATSDLKYVSSKYEARKLMEEKWKQQFDAEVYYKNQKIKEVRQKEKRIEELENALDALGYPTDGMPLNKAVDLGVKMIANKMANSDIPVGKIKTPFIGELPEGVGMGIDGQLRPYREMSDAEHQAWVAREVARAMQECATDEQSELVENYDNVHDEQIEGNCIGHTKPAEVDEAVEIVDVGWAVNDGFSGTTVDKAVEWAKRNGHHQPEGNPEPNKMDTVRIKSADEISAENIDKHTEMVCNDIAQDKSRLL